MQNHKVQFEVVTVVQMKIMVFWDVTQCHCASGIRSFKRTQYLHLKVSSNPKTDVMFLCNV